jgi:AAHS family 4-hydroxybenzoate transporter-like MFS transporter
MPDQTIPITTQDIGQILDSSRWSLFQKLIVALAAFSIVLDGFDGQMIGFAIPSLIHAWGLTRGAFTPVVVAGLVGMGIGSACAGLIADRFGRRTSILLSIAVFATATCCIGFAPNVTVLAVLRLIAGLGIGGALPTSTTLAAEFTPMRSRVMAVTLTIVCVPVGGFFTGLFAHAVIPVYGWRGLFFIGGAISLVLCLALLLLLPESPRYLARRPARWPALVKLLGRMGQNVAPQTQFSDVVEQRVELRKGLPALFQPGRRRDTFGLSMSFFLNLLAVYLAFSWLPTLLVGEGLTPAQAGNGLTVYNFGGVLGAILFAAVIGRFGSRMPMLLCCTGSAITAFLLRNHMAPGTLTWMLGLHGMFVNAVECALTALCAYAYPTAIRATGTAFALAIGRCGAISAGFAGAAVIDAGGANAYFGLLTIALIITLGGLLIIKNHVPAHAGT